MKLSDLNPDEVSASSQDQASSGAQLLTLSQLSPDDVSFVAPNPEQAKYGGYGQQALAGLEGAARGASLGTSDFAETRSGLASKEDVAAREEANPITSFLGNVAGATGLTVATGGLGGLATGIKGVLGSGMLGHALASAAEGAVFGAGNAVSDTALGDGSVNAQKILADIGMGSALGGGLGVLTKAIGAVPAFLRTKGTAEVTGAGDLVGTGKVPTSLSEMKAATENAKQYGGQEDIHQLPQKPDAVAASDQLTPLQQFPVTQMQLDSLNSADARHEFKTLLDVPGENGEILRNYQNAQKKELTSMLDNTIDTQIAPDYTPTSNALEAGDRAAQAFTDTIQKTREELSPAFEQIKSTPIAETDHLPGVIDYLTDPAKSPYGNPSIASMFDTSGDKVQIKPYNSQMGIAETAYSRIKSLVNDLKTNPTDFEGLKNARDALTDKVNLFEDNRASKQLTSAKAAMMDYMQDAVQNVDPNLAVRDTFKKWAINEQNAQLIEKKFGAEIGSGNWRSLAKGGDEGIIKKIFRDSDSVAAAKAILPPDDFNRMLADHLAILRNDATDNGAFSSNKFFSKLKQNQYALGEAFSDNGAAYGKINNALTLMRLFPDATPANPSGTAKTLIQALLNGGIDPFKHVANLIEFGKGKVEEAAQARNINTKLAGQADQAQKLKSIQGVLKRINEEISSQVQGIFRNSALRSGIISGGTYLSNEKFNKLSQDLRNYSNNPQNFIDDMADKHEDLHNAAPNINQGIMTTMASAVSFLTSKLPQPTNPLPLSPPFEPSMNQKLKFNQYFQAVNNPLIALKQIKNGSLTNETMEALQAVHPGLLTELRQKVMESLDLEKTRDLSYGKKLSLSKFLGQPLDHNMTTLGIVSNQASFNPTSQQAQVSGQPKQRSSLGGLKQLHFPMRTATATQRDLINEK